MTKHDPVRPASPNKVWVPEGYSKFPRNLLGFGVLWSILLCIYGTPICTASLKSSPSAAPLALLVLTVIMETLPSYLWRVSANAWPLLLQTLSSPLLSSRQILRLPLLPSTLPAEGTTQNCLVMLESPPQPLPDVKGVSPRTPHWGLSGPHIHSSTHSLAFCF